MTIEEFKKKYGTRTPRLIIQRLVGDPNPSKTATELAVRLVVDLESVLESVK